MLHRSVPLLLLIIFLAPAFCPRPPAAAALKARGDVQADQAVNPRPAPDSDIILPMPCGLGMVFVAVDVPAEGFLGDESFTMGADDSGRPGMGYYDRRFVQGISGPFSPADLPPAWRAKRDDDAAAARGTTGAAPAARFSYFMGKYEISTLQWRAVMDDECPAPPFSESDVEPKADISWYDAVEFSRRYNEWLIANAPDALPRFVNDSKNIGYVRLPTEAEWEFAARGGSRVPRDVLRQEDFPPLEPGTTLEEYAVFRPEGAARIFDRPQPIGSRRPNPLGIHDMAGNVAEMMLETFHFSLGNRLHGSAGGVIRKGGGFNASRTEILPGRREEMPLMHERGASRSRDTGFRLVVSGINTPDGGRADILKEEWSRLGERSGVIEEGANPLREIDRILKLTEDPTARANLLALRGVIKDANIALEREQSAAAEGLLRSAAYMLETIRNYAVRLNISVDRIKVHTEENRNATNKKSAVYAKRADLIRQYEQVAQSCRDAIRASTLFYKTRLDDLAAIPDAAYAYQAGLLQKDFAGEDLFNKNMRDDLKTLDTHRALARQGKAASLGVDALLREILPPALRVNLK